ncbi:bifunctional diaminohydroxyphosphoribosylaminopyrimidine deaminase/5-amino-6-(5-phosphoribosylamino)uracil reductase RibD [[Mycoplasma] testudinis]|uniref:bifunctional diaminohydroxyphosphoribosylaminopyrimidine deaminase/5-amino-6-(5-phosphoribosylamino)uracil reductase RibD n=1 Tax=[Mycoplasma] testudinis TaxID=33924 RepID=UPI000697C943|nr:bifunctional diaminohydroxyphosphoribosylaminopyrimidine deaminase/5-amino-6-(5-phosphoribosylamino)uracil reductase RibD [[Mycoplasma] testudinis]
MTDTEYIKICLQEAIKATGEVNPSPLVGSLIVKDDKILWQGHNYHKDGIHPETECVQIPDKLMKGATIYTTLQPCSVNPVNLPCTEAIIKSGMVSRVVIGSLLPNPIESEKGLVRFKENNIEIITGVLKNECDYLIKEFSKHSVFKKPYVLLHYTMTLDGKLIHKKNSVKLGINKKTRNFVHQIRNKYSAAMTDVLTILSDNPKMSCKLENNHDPIKIICDKNLRTPLTSNVVQTSKTTPTIIVTCNQDALKRKIYQDYGCEVIVMDEVGQDWDWNELMKILGQKDIESIIVEGSEELNWKILANQVADAVSISITPILYSSINTSSPITHSSFDPDDKLFRFKNKTVKLYESDIIVEGEIKY